MLQREMEVEAKRLNIKITISQETEPLGTGENISEVFFFLFDKDFIIEYVFFF